MFTDILKSEEDLREYIAKELKKIIEDNHTDTRDRLDAIRQLTDLYGLYDND